VHRVMQINDELQSKDKYKQFYMMTVSCEIFTDIRTNARQLNVTTAGCVLQQLVDDTIATQFRLGLTAASSTKNIGETTQN